MQTELFTPEPRKHYDLPRPVWIYVGRVAVEKNIEALLQLELPGSKVIVGVNKYPLAEEDIDLDVLEVPGAVRDEQVARLKEIRKNRDKDAIQKALDAVTTAAETDGNLLEASIAAIRPVSSQSMPCCRPYSRPPR